MSAQLDATLLEALYTANRSAEQQAADSALLSYRLSQRPALVTQAPPTTQPETALPIYGNHPTVELCDPPMFKGAADDVEQFLRDVEAHFRLQCAALVTDADKIDFFSMYLGSGAPESWFLAVTHQRPNLLGDWPSLKADFIRRFQSHNLVTKYTRKLEALSQDGPVADFANQFQEYLAFVDWSEQVKIWEFDRRLNPDLRRLLIHDRHPPTLEEWIPLVVEADNRLRDLETELEYPSSSDRDIKRSPSPLSHPSTPSERHVSLPPSFSVNDNLDPSSQTSGPSFCLPSPPPSNVDCRAYRPRTPYIEPYRPTFSEFPDPSTLGPSLNDSVPMDVDAFSAHHY